MAEGLTLSEAIEHFELHAMACAQDGIADELERWTCVDDRRDTPGDQDDRSVYEVVILATPDDRVHALEAHVDQSANRLPLDRHAEGFLASTVGRLPLEGAAANAAEAFVMSSLDTGGRRMFEQAVYEVHGPPERRVLVIQVTGVPSRGP